MHSTFLLLHTLTHSLYLTLTPPAVMSTLVMPDSSKDPLKLVLSKSKKSRVTINLT